MTATLPSEIIEVLERTSVECLKCGSGRLEVISYRQVFCPECGGFFPIQLLEKARGNLLCMRGRAGPRPEGQ